MKNKLTIASLLVAAGLFIGCSDSDGDRKVVHREVKDEPRLMGGRKYEESTTYRNADGTYTKEEKKVKTP